MKTRGWTEAERNDKQSEDGLTDKKERGIMRERKSCGSKQKIKCGKLKNDARNERMKGEEEELRAGDKKWTRGLIETK